ncbi:DUF2399 domain-containing protein [Streptomyces sp. GbtcB7]|uniref:DUF2399 domain-containing protein n=1 Tax=Streptomyces sp. GbtcB7 TaxID=2824752 RepID=UPI001C301C98|nr:DUF2399 domain-containing protein [Streptomyces sp. GbtcB7]
MAAQEHTDPFARQVRVARGTLDRWTRHDRAGGFAALVPEPSAGLARVRAVLATVPQAVVWRMTAANYTASLHPAPFEPGVLDAACLGETPWDPALAAAMRASGRPAYEEALIEELLADLRRAYPSPTTPARANLVAARRA